MGTYQVTWNVLEDSNAVATRLITFTRNYTESGIFLVNLPGVLFVISSLTGVTMNSKTKKDNASSPEVRPGLAFIVCFIPTLHGRESKICDILHRTGLTIHTAVEAKKQSDVKAVTSRSPTNSVADLVTHCGTVLKDSDKEFVRKMLTDSLTYCCNNVPNLPLLPHTSVHVVVAYDKLEQIALRLIHKLLGIEVPVSIITEAAEVPSEIDRFGSTMPKGLDLSAQYVCDFLKKKKLGLRIIFVYKNPARAKVTYLCEVLND